MRLKELKKYYHKDLKNLVKNIVGNKTNYIVLKNSLAEIQDIQKSFQKIHKRSKSDTRVVVIYYNHFWEPVLEFLTFLKLRRNIKEPNWLDEKDIENLLRISGFDVITTQRRMILPIQIAYISDLLNKYISFLPIINSFCLTMYTVARPIHKKTSEYSVSIIVPARNEEGNVKKIINNIPKFGSHQEIIFVEGNSTDNTWGEIQELLKTNSNNTLKVSAYKQRGKGKADAVRMGFKKAKGQILMIYDADRTVDAKDLEKFYNALASGQGEFINGSRLIYPMEQDAMRTPNKVGNKIFSIIFTWILGQRFKDTLCGTKAFFKKDYLKFKRFRDDPFGDFELIFGAIKNNLKVIEIPVRYKERVYGSTNISRFKHGLLLLKITFIAFKIFKAW